MLRQLCLLLLVAIACTARPAAAINIVLDYTHDDFFTDPTFPSGSVAQATLQKAANDISDAITSSLSAVTTDIHAGSFAGTTATSDWSYRYTNPTTNANETISNAVIPANEIRIFVGARNISGTTLGTAGPGAMGFGLSVSGSSIYYQNALNAAASAANTAYTRGGKGPVLGGFDAVTFNQGTPGEVTYDFEVDYTVAYGNLWFDADEDNNNVRDSWSSLDDYWHWDFASPVPFGESDLYSVALHEILHALGYGASETWNTLSSGTNWTGSEVIDLAGNGINKVIGGHVSQNSTTLSRTITDGSSQHPIMVASIPNGQRSFLTELDLAFLRDLGYETVTPEFGIPGDFNGDGAVDAADYTVWRDTLGTTGTSLAADASGNGQVDTADYNIWRANFGQTAATSLASGPAAVPEPTAVVIVAIGLLGAGLLMRRRL